METMQVVSKMAYHSEVQVAGDANDDVLVSRRYVTEELLGISPWRITDKDSYQIGTTVQHNGLIYECTEAGTDTAPGESGSKWRKISPMLGKRSGSRTVASDSSDVTITHNLGSSNLIVQVYEVENGIKTPVFVPFSFQDDNNIILHFTDPPAKDHHVIMMAFD